jgi:hypothetical protein
VDTLKHYAKLCVIALKKAHGKYGKVEVNFIGKTDLIKNKVASGRPQDGLDAKTLKKAKK